MDCPTESSLSDLQELREVVGKDQRAIFIRKTWS
jgi:hypothetical protein